MRSTSVVAGVGALMLFAACGSAESSSGTSVPPVVDTGDVDFADGALIPDGTDRDGNTVGDAVAEATPNTTASTEAPVGDATDAPTTTGNGVAGGSTSVPDGGSAGGSAGASTTVPAREAGGTATTLAPSGSPTLLGTNEGIVRIGTVDFPFEAETCDIDEFGFFVLGYGTSSDGLAVEVDMTGYTVDLDDDGVVDLNFDMYVLPNLDAGVDDSNLPDFYASKVVTETFSEGDDIIVTVNGSRVSGSGPVEDFNGVAAAEGETLPMTFEVRCA